jgi:hypothetical protein
VSLSNASATFVNLSAQTAEVNFSGTFNVPVSFNPNLVVGANAVALNLELNLAKSLPSPLPGTFTPVMTATSTNLPAINQQEEGTGAVHDLTGVVSSTGSNSFVLTVSEAATPFTIVVGGNTQFVGVSGISSLAANTIVEVNAAMQSDNTLLASKVEAEIGEGGQDEGVVTSRTVGTPNTFVIAVQNLTGNPLLLGTLRTVSADATTEFLLPGGEADLSGLPFTPSFASFADLAVGQGVVVRTPLAVPGVPPQVELALQTLRGTPTSQTGNQFTLALPSDSAFHLLTGATSIDFIVQSNTSIVLGTPVHVRGLLFFDTPSGRYKLVATRVTP